MEILEKSDSEEHSDIGENPEKGVVNVFISPPENIKETDETDRRERLEDCKIPDKRSSNAWKKKLKTRDWLDVDIKERAFTLKASIQSVAVVPRKPQEILELFMNDEIFEILTNYTVMYSAQYGNHNFALDVGEMKVFVGINLLSGCKSVTRQSMYWSEELDTRNELIVRSMPRNRFDEIVKYIHAADNDNLRMDDKFEKKLVLC